MKTRRGKSAGDRDFQQRNGGGCTCSTCGKVRYLSKAAAKRAIRQHQHRFTGRRLNAYRCGDFWHIGHLPPFVVNGEATRDDLRRRP